MADLRITEINSGTPHTAPIAPGDLVEFVDVSDTTDHTSGTSFPRSVHTLSLPLTTQTGSTYTLDGDDDLTMVVCTNAAQVTVTIPTDASDDLRDGFQCAIFAAGAGGVTLSTSGLTLLGSSPNLTVAQNEVIVVQKSATANTWVVVGGTSA